VATSLTKELKRPDEFISFWTHLGAKLTKHRKSVLFSIITVGVVSGGTWGIVIYRGNQAAKATEAFARIDRIAQATLLPEKEADKSGPDKKAADEAKKAEADDVPHFKTEKERLEAANNEADSFISKFGTEGLGRKARFGKAGRLLVLERSAEAADIYEKLAENENQPELKILQREGAAAAYEAAGKLDDALRTYTGLADECQRIGSFYLDRILFSKARILEKQGKAKDAELALREIMTKVPKTLLRQQIDDRLAVLTEK
jgi:tetratricopeptide (TPR) repeat protein